jgi:hypothetical protein
MAIYKGNLWDGNAVLKEPRSFLRSGRMDNGEAHHGKHGATSPATQVASGAQSRLVGLDQE